MSEQRKRSKFLHPCDFVILEEDNWILMGCEEVTNGWTSGIVHAVDHNDGETVGCYMLAPHVQNHTTCIDCREKMPESLRKLWFIDNFDMIKEIPK